MCVLNNAAMENGETMSGSGSGNILETMQTLIFSGLQVFIN